MDSLNSIAGFAAALITIISIWVHTSPEKRVEIGKSLLAFLLGVLIAAMICFSAYQIIAFRSSPTPITRHAVVDLLLHVFNLIMWTRLALEYLVDTVQKHRAAVRKKTAGL